MRRWLVTGLGTGYLPVAPGTWGSAAVAGIWLLAAGLGFWGETILMAAIALAASVICVALGGFAERHFGKKDPGQVTIDEWAGQAVALLALPVTDRLADRLIIATVAFVAFRVFDIMKPSPAYRLQRLPAGWGVLVDDLIAGVYANLVAQLILRWAMRL